VHVAVFQLDEDTKSIDDSIREMRQMQKYLNSIDEIVQEEVPVNKKAKAAMHELCSLACSTALDDTSAAVKQVFENINDNLRCYNKAKTESEEDKYDGTPTTSKTPLISIYLSIYLSIRSLLACACLLLLLC